MPLFQRALVLFKAACLAVFLLHSTTPLALAQSPVNPTGPSVTDRRNVTYIGITTDSGVEKFLNIPYGLDTSFGRRFKAAEPAYLREGTVYDATKKGPICPQSTSKTQAGEEMEMSEDCLRLMVARPTHGDWWTEGKKLPVMVWIHGGGLFDGNINEERYDPEQMVLQSVENKLPIIFVSMNYRLNIFGFAFSMVLKESQDINIGLKDQHLALEWVQQNIHLFGGDPDRVTIFGQSSGGLSVAAQLLAHGGKDGAPFHSAIMQSTSLQPAVSSVITAQAFDTIAKNTKCDFGGMEQISVSTLRCLRELEWSELLQAAIALRDSESDHTDGDIFLPFIDGKYFPKALSELTRRGMFAKMPVMIGWTEDDASRFVPRDKGTREFLQAYFPDLVDGTLDRIMELYPEEDFTANTGVGLNADFYRSSRIMRDILFVCPSFFFGWGMAKKYWNGNNLIFPPVYLYEFDQTIMDEPGLGVVHSSDLPYVFANFEVYKNGGGVDVHISQQDEDLRKKVLGTWTAFAHVGVPSLPSDTGTDTVRVTLEGWEGAYGEFGVKGVSSRADGSGDEMMDGKVYVIGGAHSGMATLEEQKLKERCGFLNRDDVIKELKY
ncbi:hypothetical protein D9758_010092 [Tetrapyrgos nigripes]|uniref:Carboxylic ester hydrolase n=1 Tax=Tetrapyrgos nigripes TaxID=182062 RepID=A0A8H5CS05_9AGAR|nr:hypothetical protein D9758_010092 [Tetrapyrgos nigripes]